MYIAQLSKSIGEGRKTKYNEEGKYIIDAITYAWETGNSLSKPGAYEQLIAHFGGGHRKSMGGFNAGRFWVYCLFQHVYSNGWLESFSDTGLR